MRMNNSHRKQILQRAIHDLFDKKKAEIVEQADQLMERIYQTLTTPDLRIQLNALPTQWLRWTDHYYVNAGGWTVTVKGARCLPSPKDCMDRINLTNPDLIRDVQAWEQAREDHQTKRREASTALEIMLSTARSFNVLARSWPEGKEYWQPVWEQEQRRQLPALEVASVNKVLGLPKE